MKDSHLPELARQLIINFPDDRQIRAAIAGNLWSGFSVGPLSNRLAHDLSIAKKWAEDSDPTIRKFADEVAEGLEAALPKQRIREQEESGAV